MDIESTLREIARTAEPGSKFPTVRELVSRLGVTHYAVHRAIKVLNAEGFLTSHLGSGTVVARNRTGEDASTREVRLLLLHHRSRIERSELVASALHRSLEEQEFRVVSIAFGDGADLAPLAAESWFDFCVVQPRLSPLSMKLLEIARKSARHVIIEGNNLEGMEFDMVARDRRASLRLALRHLRDLGHERLGLVSETRGQGPQYNEYEQMFDFWSELTAPPGTIPFIHRVEAYDPDAKGFGDALNEWKAMPVAQRPTALIVFGRFGGETLIRSTTERGVKIPTDLSILRIGSTSIEQLHAGFFTTVGRSAESVAAAVMELIARRRADPAAAPKTVRAAPHLVVRSSTTAPS
jgi:DNA-binding LacI/PurR family transcriptional regulator